MEKLDTNASEEQGFCQISEDYKQIYLPLTYSIIFVLGLPLNGSVLWLSWHQTKRWSCATIYLVNLMVADLLYVLTLPFLIVAYSLGDWWPFGELLCRLVRFLFYTNLYGSILLLTCISVHRFLGVCHPLRSLPYRTRRNALLGVAATWALVVLQLLPTLGFSHTAYISGHMVCYDMTSPENFDRFFAYSMILTLSGFVLPSLVILVCYSLMVRSLAKPEETLERTGNTTRAKSIRTILLVCSLFALCFVPFHVSRSFYITLRFLASQDCQLLTVGSMAYKVWRPLVSMSSCLNPVLYFLSVGNNRIRLFRKLRHDKEYTALFCLEILTNKMLGEAFLLELLYKEQKYTTFCKPLTCKKTSNDEKETWKKQLLDIEDNSLSPDKTENQQKVEKESLTKQMNDTNKMKSVDEITVPKCKSASFPGNLSVALPIPKREQCDERQLDLYRSWSCTSICQNYPDLQIGGDHVGNMYDSGCFVEHIRDDASNGPLLLSVDIPLGHSPIIEPLEKLSASKLLNGDEIREKSMLFHKQPLSNSMLNKYMENKLDELYKQFLEENLTKCLSITNLMASNLLMNNVNQFSLQISQEQNVEASKAREALLHSFSRCNLYNISHGNSSEFSTPNLQISKQRSREFVSHVI